MKDTIYREDAIGACAYETIECYEARKAIRVLPSADRPQEWIPCSERLPKENTEVLMSLEWGVDIGEYRNGEWHSEWINHYDDGNVLAWMPLPKPWKEQTMNKEMQRLRAMLDAEHIKWEDKSDMGVYPICRTHFRYKGQRWSVIHGYGTYGGYNPLTDTDRGLLEAYNFSGDPKGYLTAEEVMQYVKGADDETDRR